MAMRTKPKLLCLVCDALRDLAHLTPQFCIMPLTNCASAILVFKSLQRCQVLSQHRTFAHSFPSPWAIPLHLHPLCVTFSFSFFRSQCKYHLFGEICPEYLFLSSFCLPSSILSLSILLVTSCNLGRLDMDLHARSHSLPEDRTAETVSLLFTTVILAIGMLPAISLLNGRMNKSCSLLLLGCDVWRTDLSQNLWYLPRNQGSGSSAHRPMGKTPSDAPSKGSLGYCPPQPLYCSCSCVLLLRPTPAFPSARSNP